MKTPEIRTFGSREAATVKGPSTAKTSLLRAPRTVQAAVLGALIGGSGCKGPNPDLMEPDLGLDSGTSGDATCTPCPDSDGLVPSPDMLHALADLGPNNSDGAINPGDASTDLPDLVPIEWDGNMPPDAFTADAFLAVDFGVPPTPDTGLVGADAGAVCQPNCPPADAAVTPSDAAVLPDAATPPTPDAFVALPDAATPPTPDAFVPLPDAATPPTPDAFVPLPDAATPPTPDAFVPLPDAFIPLPDVGPVCIVLPERCNGVDDDCDGVVDNGFDVGAACPSRGPNCVDVTKVCRANGAGTMCPYEPPNGLPELCNGQDDNCNGQVDENVASEPCEVRGQPRDANGNYQLGVCRHSMSQCVDGATICPPSAPRPQVCGNLDEHDNYIDESCRKNPDLGCACPLGAQVDCTYATEFLNANGAVESVCNPNPGGNTAVMSCNGGSWGECVCIRGERQLQ